MRSRETHVRSLAKTISWRVLMTIGTWAGLYLFTGKATESLIFTGIAAVLGIAVYYAHERIWNTVSWGKGHG